jgi:hypothetical protein
MGTNVTTAANEGQVHEEQELIQVDLETAQTDFVG